MKRISKWKKTVLLSCASGLLAFGGIAQTNVTTVWALPSSGESTSGNIIVRDNVNGNQIGSLNEGQKVTIKGQKEGTDGYNWYEITFDWNGVETDGWVRSDLINTGSSENENSPQENENTEGEAEDGDFLIGSNAYDIADSIPQEDIPDDFSETKITYAGEEVPAVKFEYADLFLLYLQNVSDSSDAGFYVFDSERDSAVPFILEEMKDGYVILVNVPGEIASGVSGRYVQSDCNFENGRVIAYQLQEADDYTDAAAAISDFYYMYGITQSGESGWYLYDSANEALQRSIVNMQYKEAVQEDDAKDDSPISFDTDSITRMLVAGLGLFSLLLLILVIIFSVRYRKLRRFLEEECDEDEADEVYLDEDEPKIAANTRELEEKLGRHQEKISDKMFEINLPNGKVDLMDLDEEYEGGYDVKVDRDADYDLKVEDILKYYDENEPEYYDEPDAEPEIKLADPDSEEEPEFYDEEENEAEPPKEPEKEEKKSEKQDSEWDDELEFL